MKVAAVLLAGGRSERMGSPKAMLRLGSETFLMRLLRTLEAAGLDDIAIVTGAHDAAIRTACADLPLEPGVSIVFNPRHEMGQLSSLLAGLDAIEPHHPDAALMALIDHPLVHADTIVRIVSVFLETRAWIVRPVYEGRHGHPVLFSSEVFPALRSAPLSEGAKAIVRAAGEHLIEVPVDDAGVVEDIDTPQDFERIRRAMRLD